ncbi:MAG: BlaI/MecI/CopY family transcriptional regulator [Verrucomicrobiales bacterium]
MSELSELSRRERQIMEIVYGRDGATATDVLESLHDPPTRTSVRTLLRILEEKGHLRHTKRGREFVFYPTRPRERAGKSAFQRVLETFFGGSLEEALAAHLLSRKNRVTGEERDRLVCLIDQARKEGR